MAARLKASAVFLTYSQIGEDRPLESIVDFLKNLPFVQGGIACLELHQDGGKHWHAWLDLKSQSTFTPTRFDFDGLHPNVIITPGQKKSAACQNRITYCKKDGNFVIFPDDYELPTTKEKDTTWQDVFNSATREEALTILGENQPRDAVINARQIDYFLDKKFAKKEKPYVPTYQRDAFTRVPAVVDEYVSANLGELSFSSLLTYTYLFLDLPRLERPKSLFLISPSRFGKTKWARSLGNHAYIANQWDLSAFEGKGDDFWVNGYVVFDDVSWDSFKHSAKSFCGCQQDFSVSDKYKRKQRLVGGIPCIVLLNPDAPDFDEWRTFYLSDWGRQNIVNITLVMPLF